MFIGDRVRVRVSEKIRGSKKNFSLFYYYCRPYGIIMCFILFLKNSCDKQRLFYIAGLHKRHSKTRSTVNEVKGYTKTIYTAQ